MIKGIALEVILSTHPKNNNSAPTSVGFKDLSTKKKLLL